MLADADGATGAALGADPTIVDTLHGGTPAGWARFGGHAQLADLLEGAGEDAS